MKTGILLIAAFVILSGCSEKKIKVQTRLGMGTQYRYFPETLKGKVKEMHETNYWAVVKDGKDTKGNPMTVKDLDSIGTLRNAIVASLFPGRHG